MDKVRAKMRCDSAAPSYEGASDKNIRLFAVTGNDPANPENADYARWTPSGGAHLTVNPGTKAADTSFFEPGAEYYVTFEKVPKAEPATV